MGAARPSINPYHAKIKAERHSFILYFHGNLLHVKNTVDGKLKVSTNGTTGFFFPFPTINATYHRQKAKQYTLFCLQH